MKILIIGGAGYIGSHISRYFLDNGYSVTIYDNLSTGTRENVFRESVFEEGDILDYENLLAVTRKDFDAVIHCAAFKAAGESMEKPEKYAENNLCGTINILNAAVRSGIRLLVFSSSAAVYGEPMYLPVDEAHSTQPENFYGFTKLEIERILSWYDSLKGLRFAALRYFNAAGYDPAGRITGLEQNPANLLPVIMETAVGVRNRLYIYGDDYNTRDGTGVRDYIHVTDLADAHLKALSYIKKQNTSIVVNLGSESGLSVLNMLETAREITGKPIPSEVVRRRPGDPAKLVASSQKARALLGWKSEYSDVETLIRTSWEVYRKRFL